MQPVRASPVLTLRGVTPSACTSASLMLFSLSTRTLVTSSVMRLAQRGMWMLGLHGLSVPLSFARVSPSAR